MPKNSNTHYDVILHNLSRHKDLEEYKIPGAFTFLKRLPIFLSLIRISALLSGQLVLKYSILMSMTRKSSGRQWWSSTKISLLKKRLESALIFASIDSIICVCKCRAPCSPNFWEEKLPSYLVSTPDLRRSNLSFIFQLPLESCNSQMLCLL